MFFDFQNPNNFAGETEMQKKKKQADARFLINGFTDTDYNLIKMA